MPPRHRGNVITATFDRKLLAPNVPSSSLTLLRKGSQRSDYSGPEGAESVNVESDGTEYIVAHDQSGETIKINRNSLHRYLSHLFTLRDRRIDSLSGVDAEIFRTISDVSKMISHDENYKSFIREVENIGAAIRSLTDLQPSDADTVGSFLEGCFTKNNFQGPAQCSPHCAGSLPLPNSPPCDAMSLLKTKEGTIFAKNPEITSDKAYIHVKHDAAPLNSADFDLLAQGGIKFLSIIQATDAKGNYTQSPLLPLEQHRGTTTSSPQRESLSDGGNTGTTGGGGSAAGIILFVLLVLVLIGIILAIVFGSGARAW